MSFRKIPNLEAINHACAKNHEPGITFVRGRGNRLPGAIRLPVAIPGTAEDHAVRPQLGPWQ